MTTLRLLGNTVLVEPVKGQKPPESLIERLNYYDKHTLIYKVKAVGPGRWKKIGKKQVFVKPEVEVGDFILTKAMFQPESVKQHFSEDAKGAMIIDAEACMAKWRNE